MELDMENKNFKGATIELTTLSEDSDFDFEVNINEVKEVFYDAFYSILQEDAEEFSPEEMTQQAKAMLDAIDIEFEQDKPEAIPDEVDRFCPNSGHYTETVGVNYSHTGGITISKKTDSTLDIEDIFIDIAVDDYKDNVCDVDANYCNYNAMEAKKEQEAAALKLQNEQPKQAPAPDDHTKPKFTP
jgi:hypothetical protein